MRSWKSDSEQIETTSLFPGTEEDTSEEKDGQSWNQKFAVSCVNDYVGTQCENLCTKYVILRTGIKSKQVKLLWKFSY
jgi:hypothetical protein